MFKSLPTLRATPAALGALILLALAGCYDDAFVVGTIRFKLSMTFQVDDRQVTASTVQVVGFADSPSWTGAQGPLQSALLRGASLVVDLGSLGSLTPILPYSGYSLAVSCGVEQRSAKEELSAWVERLRVALKTCDFRESKSWKFPRLLRGLPIDQVLPPVGPIKSWGAKAPAGFVVLTRDQLQNVFGERVHLLRAWFEPTNDLPSAESLAQVRWMQPILDGSVPILQVPLAGSDKAMTLTRNELFLDRFTD